MTTAEPFTELGTIRQAFASVALQSAGGLIVWLMVVYFISLLSLMLGQGIWHYTAAISLLSIPVWVLLARERGTPRTLLTSALATLLTFAILSFGFWIAADYYDLSWDGAAYHQEAIIWMVEGWKDFPAQPPSSVPYHSILGTYPKAMEIISASLYQTTSSLDGAKLLHLALAASAFLLLLSALLRELRFPFWAALLIATVAALNPVTIYQSLSFYVDGQLASLLTGLIGLTLLLLRRPRLKHLVLFVALIVLTINIKQTGVAYAGLFVIASLALIYFRRREWFSRALLAAATGGLLGALLFGYNPYVTNTINYGNPFYPIIGMEGQDMEHMERGQRPPGFEQRAGISRLLLSTFSKPTVAINAPMKLQAPFMGLDKQSITSFSGADVRLGGWGVLFSGALVLGLVGLLLVSHVPKGPRSVGLILLGTVIISTVINPEAWWARFAPQWYLVALIPGAMLVLGNKLWARCYGLLVLGILLINSALIAYAYYPSQREVTGMIREHLQWIAQQNELITIHFGAFPSNRMRLREAGIRYMVVPKLSQLKCPDPHRIFMFEGHFCFLNEE